MIDSIILHDSHPIWYCISYWLLGTIYLTDVNLGQANFRWRPDVVSSFILVQYKARIWLNKRTLVSLAKSVFHSAKCLRSVCLHELEPNTLEYFWKQKICELLIWVLKSSSFLFLWERVSSGGSYFPFILKYLMATEFACKIAIGNKCSKPLLKSP